MNSSIIAENKRGFTLIELLVVIGILGLIMAIVLVSLSTAQERARDSKRMSDMAQIIRALELYRAETGEYPAREGTQQQGACSQLYCLSRLTDALVPTYLPEIPHDPVAGNTSSGYRYCRPSARPDIYQIIVRPEKTSAFCTVRTPVTISGTDCWTTNGTPDFPYCS